ncbi:MAG: hypothetical protein RR090_05105 [Niameybacter sp.]|uniref:hypothetical protein n=1 Tax=Niameybacter sp. TaxID=2033640 RepID=UPI002FC9A875
MNKNNLKKAAVVLAFLMITVNCLNTYRMQRELEYLRSECQNLNNSLQRGMDNVSNKLHEEYGKVETLLTKEQSIFSETSIDLKGQGNKIVVTMRAIPKKMANTETLIARITAGEKVYEQEVASNNEAVMLIGMVETIQPMFIIQSEEGVRQETLEECYTGGIFDVNMGSEWEDRDSGSGISMVLNLWTEEDASTLPFPTEDVEKAEFIIVNSGIVEDGNSAQGQRYTEVERAEHAISEEVKEVYFEGEPQGESVPAMKMSQEGRSEICYSGDFSEYAKREDGILYKIYFTLTTKDGMQYVTRDNPVASFSQSKRSSSRSSGGTTIMPLFKE